MQQKLPHVTNNQIHLSAIRNYYWHLRNIRAFHQARRRKLYRQIEKQKAVLIENGLHPEALRLWCRQFTSCKPEAASLRFLAFVQKNDIDLKIFLSA